MSLSLLDTMFQLTDNQKILKHHFKQLNIAIAIPDQQVYFILRWNNSWMINKQRNKLIDEMKESNNNDVEAETIWRKAFVNANTMVGLS